MVKFRKQQPPQPRREEGFWEMQERAGRIMQDLGNIAFDLV